MGTVMGGVVVALCGASIAGTALWAWHRTRVWSLESPQWRGLESALAAQEELGAVGTYRLYTGGLWVMMTMFILVGAVVTACGVSQVGWISDELLNHWIVLPAMGIELALIIAAVIAAVTRRPRWLVPPRYREVAATEGF